MAESETDSRSDLRLLDARKVRVRRDSFGKLHLEIGIEERYGPVHVFRCLPLTQPDRYISLQEEEGAEIGILPQLGELDGESRRLLEEELDLYYLKARVQGIEKVENRNGLLAWYLVTDRGKKTVFIRDRQHIRPLGDGRVILTDIHEAKYEVPRAEMLDDRSRHWLESEM